MKMHRDAMFEVRLSITSSGYFHELEKIFQEISCTNHKFLKAHVRPKDTACCSELGPLKKQLRLDQLLDYR